MAKKKGRAPTTKNKGFLGGENTLPTKDGVNDETLKKTIDVKRKELKKPHAERERNKKIPSTRIINEQAKNPTPKGGGGGGFRSFQKILNKKTGNMEPKLWFDPLSENKTNQELLPENESSKESAKEEFAKDIENFNKEKPNQIDEPDKSFFETTIEDKEKVAAFIQKNISEKENATIDTSEMTEEDKTIMNSFVQKDNQEPQFEADIPDLPKDEREFFVSAMNKYTENLPPTPENEEPEKEIWIDITMPSLDGDSDAGEGSDGSDGGDAGGDGGAGGGE